MHMTEILFGFKGFLRKFILYRVGDAELALTLKGTAAPAGRASQAHKDTAAPAGRADPSGRAAPAGRASQAQAQAHIL